MKALKLDLNKLDKKTRDNIVIRVANGDTEMLESLINFGMPYAKGLFRGRVYELEPSDIVMEAIAKMVKKFQSNIETNTLMDELGKSVDDLMLEKLKVKESLTFQSSIEGYFKNFILNKFRDRILNHKDRKTSKTKKDKELDLDYELLDSFKKPRVIRLNPQIHDTHKDGQNSGNNFDTARLELKDKIKSLIEENYSLNKQRKDAKLSCSDVLLSFHWAGLSYDEMANIYESTPNALKVKKAYCFGKLKKAILDYYPNLVKEFEELFNS